MLKAHRSGVEKKGKRNVEGEAGKEKSPKMGEELAHNFNSRFGDRSH